MPGRAHRLFCAVFPPADVVDSLRSLLSSHELPAHRVVPADQVHLTVMFIGDTRSSELSNVEESVRRAASGVGAFHLQPRRLISLPLCGAVRQVVVETDAPASLQEIHRRLVSRLARRPAERNAGVFEPHLTLCRFAGSGALGLSVERAIAVERFLVDRVELVESVLYSTGAEYRRVGAVPLQG